MIEDVSTTARDRAASAAQSGSHASAASRAAGRPGTFDDASADATAAPTSGFGSEGAAAAASASTPDGPGAGRPSGLPGTLSAARAAARNWRSAYGSRLVFSDLLVLVWVVFGVQIGYFGYDTANANFVGDLAGTVVSYTAISLAIIVGWMVSLTAFGSRGYRVVGVGVAEYKLIADASVRWFGLVAIIAFLFKIDLARGYILIAFPVGMVVLMFSRWMWRQWLGVQRARGAYSSQVLLVGSEESTSHIARELQRQPAAGYRVVGACIPSGRVADYLPGTTIPVSGNVDSVMEAMDATGADTLVITSSDELSPQKVRELSWNLEPGRQHLVVAPALTDLGGPRIHTRPVAGLPLIHVETPRYEGRKQVAKRLFDIVASGVLILVLSPVLALIALTVRLTSPGPVLFRQQRVGIRGSMFSMLKFRSMVTDAEALLPALQAESRGAGNEVLFKMKDDPRITRIGKVLRRYSLDELPQLFNVFGGSMSLVGPRPPLESEVSSYEKHVHRRFLVKPGVTGLWQVSGRSNLSWEDSVRLDLYYVENWSITGDIIILWRTAKAVVAKEGAY
ncbi:sugar transferase [Okibacterium fritillariae]|uniref:Undecaprenyl-phosphate galactose phosphotransferase, WbaP/exopolysaccharide biosynthesis polyprenyl glycosylphosphotransferase n=1 Tax=Okibacterium fritillariae TaxID=123320 RepID=A0A1T5KAF7_9MICO|nr:sugar transferase [Okibacterium fritillariae]SKC60712.1 Undecaprenyl-phosphate galactose phosphotransferase, WbaP/exopolysaccharide biosynthesis polyprenyl glycosylphosphotransferase [Okibacterium fritillariae]